MEGKNKRKSKIELRKTDYLNESPIFEYNRHRETEKPKSLNSPEKVLEIDKSQADIKSPVVLIKTPEKEIVDDVLHNSKTKSLQRKLKTPKSVLKKEETNENTPVSTRSTLTDSVRRSGRSKKPSLKALEATASKQSPVKWRKTKSISSSESESEPDFENEDEIEKPTALFEEKDVEGRHIFGFQTPKRRNALLQKALSVSATTTPISELRKQTEDMSLSSKVTKTPAAVRNKYKKNLARVVREIEEDSFSDFSPSDSEYEPSDSSSTTESSPSEIENSDDENLITQKTTTPKTPTTTRKKQPPKNRKDINYTLQSDDYFATHTSKSLTSDNTLDKLKNPRLTQDKINEILKNVTVNRQHDSKIKELCNEYRSNFEKWLFLLCEGSFNVLLYGLGSKKRILEQFNAYLAEQNMPVIFINGFFPSLTIKDIIDAILSDLLNVSEYSSNILEAVDEIREHLINNDVHLFLIVNNIDGEMLRNPKAQNVLSKLATISKIHLIASIDDINAPLIWDHKKLNRYNFTWWDTTTFLPYIEETSFEGSLLVQQSGALTLSSLKNIFQSLTTNARGIFTIIVKYQLEHKNESQYQGMMFKDLYWACREAFLVSSDIALRAQLTEFLDHKLIKSKRSLDGVELLYIPIESALLQRFLELE